MICPNCKKNNKPDSLFCEYCGSQLKKQKKSKKGLWITLSVIFVVIAAVIAVSTPLMTRKMASHGTFQTASLMSLMSGVVR